MKSPSNRPSHEVMRLGALVTAGVLAVIISLIVLTPMYLAFHQ